MLAAIAVAFWVLELCERVPKSNAGMDFCEAPIRTSAQEAQGLRS